ncbi:ABC transporter permease [Defluviimonas sp. WL0002]|uniref:ABC transporter permease n=1 Tax=Albidovulum marisflavi TaxID=2984159 RepID=A0ABT2Z992_9RHOB|nr:FtsX-like permease family protein [Defluviimonas sp. WL0002]MCV2867671.1 ABC transporter permease [Defluviimonas sp. WL0002]
MNPAVAWRIARRDLRGGLRGFAVFLACLILGVAAIAAVGTVRSAISEALSREGAALLGGDAQMSFTYRFASEEERAFMRDRADAVSEIVDFRSMAVVGEGQAAERALTQVKAVDDAYPLVGALALEPSLPLDSAFEPRDGAPGAVMDGVLADRLGLDVGDRFRLGLAEFRLGARLVREPDGAMGGMLLGPRTIVLTRDLQGSGLLEPGSVFDTRYRLRLPAGTDLAQLQREAEAAFMDTGMRWRDARRGAPGAERFVDRMGSFLVLVGLAGLAVGGIGIASAVRAYLEGKTGTIAALKAVGADTSTIFLAYALQIGGMTALGILLGLLLGIALPVAAAPVVADLLPIPVQVAPSFRPAAEAALYGVLTAALFTLWPLARVRDVRAAALFRDLGAGRRRWPGRRFGAALTAILTLFVAVVLVLAAMPTLALATLGGIAGALALLAGAAWVLRQIARRLSHRVEGRPGLRLALAAVAGPREEASAVVLALGLGLSVLAAVGQIDANLRAAIDRDLPEVAPSFFFVDIQNDQLDGFRDSLAAEEGVSKVDTAPMLRAVVTRINGRDAREVSGDHWVLRGDRGLTYAALPPEGTKIVAGSWWPEDYAGPPQMSFAAEEAAELGLDLGDKVTVNVLGRDIEAEITSFREVDFSTAGIGFVMLMNPAALGGAPHTHIATVYADPASDSRILREVAGAYPNITAIPVREVVDRVSEILGAIARATAIAAGVTLLTGVVVLIGAAASGQRARVYEAAVLKVLGATRGRILASFALRSALMGAAAGLVAIAFGGVAGFAVMHFVMDAPYRFEPTTALAIVSGGITATLVAGLLFALPVLGARPARILRGAE